jgi:hypothetical protein
MRTSGPVRVTKVTVKYAANGKSFTVDFDPAKLRTIVFDQGYMKDARAKEVGGRTKNAQFDPDRIIPRVISSKADKSKVDKVATHAIAGKQLRSPARKAARAVARPYPRPQQPTARLWWLTSENVWFHPPEESES